MSCVCCVVVGCLLNTLLLVQNTVKVNACGGETWTPDCLPLRREALSVFEVFLEASLLKVMTEASFLWLWCVAAYSDWKGVWEDRHWGGKFRHVHPGAESLGDPGRGQVSH